MIGAVATILVGVFLLMIALMYIRTISFNTYEIILLLVLVIFGALFLAYGFSLI